MHRLLFRTPEPHCKVLYLLLQTRLLLFSPFRYKLPELPLFIREPIQLFVKHTEPASHSLDFISKGPAPVPGLLLCLADFFHLPGNPLPGRLKLLLPCGEPFPYLFPQHGEPAAKQPPVGILFHQQTNFRLKGAKF